MKTVTLTLGERVKAVDMLNTGNFNNSTLAVVLDDIKKIAITPDEWKAANLKKTPTDEERAAQIAALPEAVRATTAIPQVWNWDETEATSKTIECGQETIDTLKDIIKKKSDASELTLADASIVTLGQKLEA